MDEASAAPEGFAETVLERLRRVDGRIEGEVRGTEQIAVRLPSGREAMLDVHNLWRSIYAFTEDGPRDVTGEIDRHVKAFVRRMDDRVPTGDAFRKSLRVVVRHVDTLKVLLGSQPEGSEAALAVQQVGGDLVALLVVDSGEHMMYVFTQQLEAEGLGAEEARALALENTWNAELGDKVEIHGDGPRMLTCGGNYEASLLMYGGPWDRLSEGMRGRLVVAAPTRDVMLVADGGIPEHVAQLRAHVAEAFDKELPYPLTQRLLRYAPDGSWEVVRPLPTLMNDKHCPTCDIDYAKDRLVCLECGDALEDSDYGMVVLVVLALALVFEGVLWGLGVRDGGYLRYTVSTTTLFAIIGYPLLKFVQWRRDPQRPILAEMGSIFGSRLMRGVLALVTGMFVYYTVVRGVPLANFFAPAPPSGAFIDVYDWARKWVIFVALIALTGLVIWDQGWRFFDHRTPNTYAVRERERLGLPPT